MKKDNVITTNVGELTGHMTCAQASVCCASGPNPPTVFERQTRENGQTPPLKAPTQQDQKRSFRGNPKRTPADENTTNMSDNAALQRKRRAVLQDVTNVCCDNFYRNCFNIVTIRAKNSKQAKRGQVKESKVAFSVAADFPQLQTDSETKSTQETVNAKTMSEAMWSITSEENVPPWLSTIRECGRDNQQLANHDFRMPLQLPSPPKKDKGSLSGNLIISRNPGIVDIDSDHKDPQLCILYAYDVYSNLRVAELIRRPCYNFMETIQRDITQSMRGILVDWLVEVSEEYKLEPDTLYLTVYLIDRFLSQNYIKRQRLQLLGITCMLIASKYEETCAPCVEEFCFITDNTYTRGEVLKMEVEVLKYFGFYVYAPTTKTFLRRYLRAAQATYKGPSLELEYLANYLSELTLLDYGFLIFLPSTIAASAVFLARWTLDQSRHPWNPTLDHYTSYNASDLQTTVVALQELQLNKSGCPLNAIRKKYRQKKFKSIAVLSSPELLETLF